MRTQPPSELEDVAARFMTHRPKLYAIAYRALGSPWAADDAVQEAWLRLQRADVDGIDNLEGWLTTVISRVCIDLIRQEVSRREDLDADAEESGFPASGAGSDPVEAAMRADDLAVAMRVVLDVLGPLERLALILHDVFALSYEEIAPIVERSAVAARQLASRSRARVRGVDAGQIRERHDAAIRAFLEAARQGDFGALLQLLDPDIELRSDDAAVARAAEGAEQGAPLLDHRVNGSDAVARVFAGRAELTRLVFIEGVPAAAYVADGHVRALFLIRFDADRIARLDVLADPVRLSSLTTALR